MASFEAGEKGPSKIGDSVLNHASSCPVWLHAMSRHQACILDPRVSKDKDEGIEVKQGHIFIVVQEDQDAHAVQQVDVVNN